MTVSFRRGRWYYVKDGSVVSVDAGASAPTDPPPSSFVADTLTASNTGVRSGVTLVNQGATTYTSANNGQTVSSRRFTGRVTLDGVQNMTFVDCQLQFQDYYMVNAINGALNNAFNYCEFDLSHFLDSGGPGIFGEGIDLFRCHAHSGAGLFTPKGNSSARESLFDKLSLGHYGVHSNSIAMFHGGNNIVIEDCNTTCGYRILGYSISGNVCTITTDGQMFHATLGGGVTTTPVGFTIGVEMWTPVPAIDGTHTITAVSGETISFAAAAADQAYTAAQGTCMGWQWLGAGGLTSALSIITDFGSNDGVVIRRCRIEGGSYAAYVPGQEGNGDTIRNVEFVDNRLSGGQYGDVTGSSPDASILHWHGNIHDPGRTGSGTTVQMPSIGGERA